MITKGLSAFALGVFLHHAIFIHGEWHLQAPRILVTHAVIFALVYLIEQAIRIDSWRRACGQATIFISLYLSGLFLSISIYRLYFHRLRKFPGPRLAALSKLYHVWQCRYSKGHYVLESWHQQYGSFVRTGPTEITVIHPAIHDAMDGPKNRNSRSDWYDLIHPRIGSIFTRDRKMHETRRKVWDNALSTSALSEYYKRVDQHVQTLLGVIEKEENEPMAMNDLIYWFAFDTMGEFGFGKDFGIMKSKQWLDGALYLRSAIALLGPFTPAIWIPRIAFALCPGVWKVKDWLQMLAFADRCIDDRQKNPPQHADIASWLLEAHKQYEGSELGQRLLGGDTTILVVAGSDTSAPTLIVLLYFIAKYPEHAAKIQAELENVDSTDVKAVSELLHLTGTINESMRLLPAVLTFGSRITPQEGLLVDGTFIPGNTKICAPRYSIGRLEAAYQDPLEFIPERWYSRPDLIKDKRAFAPFGLGRMSCAGKQLAMAQLRLVAAALLARYNMRLSGDDDGALERDMGDQLMSKPGKLELVFERRRT